MIEGLVLLLVFQLLGNVAEMYFHLPVPGSVLGMFLLLVALIANDRLASWVRPISLILISYLAVLFVPAGVGIMLHIDRLKNEALPIGVSLVVMMIFISIIIIDTFNNITTRCIQCDFIFSISHFATSTLLIHRSKNVKELTNTFFLRFT